MADVITRFKLETTQYDSKLRDAAKGLREIVHQAELGGNGFQGFSQKSIEAARSLGQIESGAINTKDRLKDLVGSFNDVAKAYNNLTQEQQQSDFGRAMSQSLEQLQQRIKQTKNELYSLDDAADKVKDGGLFGGDMFGGMLQVAGGNLMTKAAGFAMDLANELGEAVTQGIELAKQGEGIRIAFERLGRGDILQGLREATHGTVTDLELMKAAVKFNDFKLPLEELGTMLSFAQQKAKDTGQSVDYMVDSIVTGLGRKSLMILDNLGLSATEVKEKMAETGDMTKAVGAIIREQMAKAGDYVETAADRTAQANVSLQNKMEELGRKFAPVEEASSHLWTSMKIAILDIIGGPLATLLNQLTEAGRLKNMLNQVNGGGDTGGDTQVNKQLAKLRVAQRAGSGYMTNSLYNDQIEQYNRKLNAARNMKKQYEDAGMFGGRGLILGRMSRQFNVNVNGIEDIDNLIASIQTMKDEYDKGAKAIMNNPIKLDVDTTKATQDINSLNVKLAELQGQRKKAIEAGDTEKSKQLLQQINQVKADIKGLDPTALNTGGTNPIKQAQDKVAAAQHEYAQSIEKAKMSLDNGTSTEADYKKKLLSAEERLWDALGDAHNVYADPKYKQAQDECAAKIKLLGGEVTASVEAQKKAQEAARQLEQAQKKLADAEREQSAAAASGLLGDKFTADKKVARARADMQTAQNNIDTLQGKVPTYLTKKQKAVFQIEVDDTKYEEFVRTFQGRKDIKINTVKGDTYTPEELPDQNVKVNIEADTQEAYDEINRLTQDIQGRQVTITPVVSKAKLSQANLDAIGKEMTLKIQNVELGSAEYEDISARLFDATAVQNLMQETLRMGLTVPEDVRQGLIDALTGPLEEGIPDEVFDKWVEQLNQFRADNPLVLDMQTGKVSGNQEGESGKGSTDKALRDISKGISGLSSIQSGLEGLGIKVPSEIEKALGVINALMTVIQGVQTVISIFSTGAETANTIAVGLNTAAVVSLEAAIWANTATSLIPFMRNGGIAHAANGFVPGNDHNDNIPVMVSSGELILNRAQQGNIASQLQDGAQQNRGSEASSPYVTGETIFLGVNNYLQRSGRGEIVTTKQR